LTEFHILQESCRVDNHLGSVDDLFASSNILDLNLPLASNIIPDAVRNPVIQLYKVEYAISLCAALEIIEKLFCTDVSS
jgi:hypothetical protein